jgi:hypothetical protein
LESKQGSGEIPFQSKKKRRKRGKREGARLLRFAGDPARVSIHTMEASESSAEWMGWDEPLALSPLLDTAVFFYHRFACSLRPFEEEVSGCLSGVRHSLLLFSPNSAQSPMTFLIL